MMKRLKKIKCLGIAGACSLCMIGLVACGAGGGTTPTTAPSGGAAQPAQTETETGGAVATTAAAKEAPLEFQTIKLSVNNMTAQNTVYYAQKTEAGVHLEYYMAGSHWDDKAEEPAEDRRMIREYDAGAKVYRQLAQSLADAGVKDWDGYSESDPDVMDGYGFSFEAVLEDGATIGAEGSNSFPDGYETLFAVLAGICRTEELKSTTFDGGAFTIELPKAWVGEVYAEYLEDYTAFRMIDAPEHYLTGVYVTPYPYEEESYVQLGTFEKDGETYYIAVRNLTMLHLPDMNVLTAEQVAIVESAPDMLPDIAASFKLK